MRKSLIIILSIILCVACAIVMVACDNGENHGDNNPQIEMPDIDEPSTEKPNTDIGEPSVDEPSTDMPDIDEPGTEDSNTTGLEYRANSDLRSYSVVGIGEATSSNIIIPETYNGLPVIAIGEYAFEGITGLESICLPKTIVDIGQFAFHNCSELKDIALLMCTPKVRHFWRCIFYGKKRAKAKEV